MTLLEDDPGLTSNYATDIDGTTNFDGDYDLIGRLTAHTEEDITAILWDPYQKIRRINFSTTASKPKFLEFFYDRMGNRTLKRALYDGDVIETDRDIRHTWHVHDASGNVVSTYQLQEDYESSTEWYTLEVRQSEVPLYGSARLGLHLTDRIIQRYYNDDDANGYDDLDTSVPTLATGTITSHSREVGHKAYELSNHLGNVLATVSDRKWPVFSEPKPGKWQFEHFQAELLSSSEYYPFGMEMPGRIASSESYRYGFQGQEKDDEIKGPGNSINYKFRMHDPRMGRFLSVDPEWPKFAMNSPYAISANNPIALVDLQGRNPTFPESFLGGDPRLEYDALLKNPKYQELDIYEMRANLKLDYPTLKDWEINISVGNALETAYGEFTGFKKNRTNLISRVGNKWYSFILLKIIRPDFIHANTAEDPEQGREFYFPVAGVVEVKASQNSIDLTTSRNQIDAELNLAMDAQGISRDGTYIEATAGQFKAGSLTLVLPGGGKVSQKLIDEATARNVNLYVQYTFKNIDNGKVVFSNPQRLNFISNELPTDYPGNLDNPVILDPQRATRWAPSLRE